MSETSQHGSAAARGLASAAATLILIGLAAGAWYFGIGRRAPDPAPARHGELPPEDPRLAYNGPFRNIAPDVKYVGSAACGTAGCHDTTVASFRHHPMGRSMFLASEVDPAPPEDAAHHNPFEALGSQFRVERDGGVIRHRRTAFDAAGQPVYDMALEADYAIGSGAHGHSYLTVRKGGYVFQTPISWYTEKQRWDLSPGFGESLAAGRPAPADCLFCHANHTEPIDGSVNRYREPVFDGLAIGCERCHGPGELHVAARRRNEPVEGDVDFTIVNPGRLDPPLREAVCEQCHLAGEARVVRRGRHLNDFRPGLPLTDVLSVFVRATVEGHGNNAVNHVEQMHLSRCFRESTGDNKLGCVSCHDPHVHVVDPAERVAHYRDSCLACHAVRGCTLAHHERVKISPQDSCIDCHMPRRALGNIPHTAATDHRIIRFRRAGDEPHAAPLPTGPGFPVRAFHLPEDEPGGPEMERAMGIALMGPLAGRGRINPKAYSSVALHFLEEAVARDPEDWDAWEAKANALQAQGRGDEALAALKVVLAKAPRRETALARAAALAQDSNLLEPALDYWRRAAEVNPWSPTYQQSLCTLLAHTGSWEEMRPHAEAWLRLAPASIDARKSRVTYLLHAGRKDEARKEFDTIRALRPADLDKLQSWFDAESK